MFGFHSRSRSLIPVKDLEKMDNLEKTAAHVEYCDEEPAAEEEKMEWQTPRQKRNLTMIYLLFLAEAIMASSLTSQIAVLVPSASTCLGMDVAFLRSILECAYFFGSAAGMLWGWSADRIGRRKIALLGLLGMSTCCLCMGFATTFQAFALLRFAGGAFGSAVAVAGLAMLADSTYGSQSRSKIVARLPVIAVCGSIGPLAANALHELGAEHVTGLFIKYPGLSGQIACASLVTMIALAEALLLEETLPQCVAAKGQREEYDDSEKATFLGSSLPRDSEDSLDITIVEALNNGPADHLPSRITIVRMVTAPSVLVLLVSFSVLSLHSSTFEVLLPHLGHTASHEGGMGIPCSWMRLLTMLVKVIAALRISRVVPFIVGKVGLLPMYRKISLVFPGLYVLIPLVGLVVSATGTSSVASSVFSTLAMLAQTTLAGAAQVLVLLLVFSAAPDASSTGTIIGVISLSQLFRALAVGISGLSYYLSDEYTMFVLNICLWAGMAVTALVGATITWRLRETPRVGTDIPQECLAWQGIFDLESDDEAGV